MCSEAQRSCTHKMLDPEIKGRIVAFLQKFAPKDYSIKEIAEGVKIHRNTAGTYLKVLVAEGKIKLSRILGRIPLYTIIDLKDKKQN